ncbi:MAG: D-glycerate dehydrogenase, partial [Maricaulaceae bacterium]
MNQSTRSLLPAHPHVVVTRQLPEDIEARLTDLFGAKLNCTPDALSQDDLKSAVAKAHVLVPTVTDRIDADVIAAAGSQLKLIANFGAGTEH